MCVCVLCVCEKSLQSYLNLCDPMGCSHLDLSVHAWDSPGKNIGVGCYVLLQGTRPNPGIELIYLMSRALLGRFFAINVTWEAHNILNISIFSSLTFFDDRRNHSTKYNKTCIIRLLKSIFLIMTFQKAVELVIHS